MQAMGDGSNPLRWRREWNCIPHGVVPCLLRIMQWRVYVKKTLLISLVMNHRRWILLHFWIKFLGQTTHSSLPRGKHLCGSTGQMTMNPGKEEKVIWKLIPSGSGIPGDLRKLPTPSADWESLLRQPPFVGQKTGTVRPSTVDSHMAVGTLKPD